MHWSLKTSFLYLQEKKEAEGNSERDKELLEKVRVLTGLMDIFFLFKNTSASHGGQLA